MAKKRGVGEALKDAVVNGKIEVPFDKRPREMLMVNIHRHRIFQFLCIRPCSHLRQISREMGRSIPSISWHLQKLVDAEYVCVKDFKGKKIYYPKYMIDEDRVDRLVYLNRRDVEAFISAVSKYPGITMREYEALEKKKIPERVMRECVKMGLINVVKDGKYNRYYIGEWKDENSERIKFFVNYISKKLGEEGITTSCERKTDGEWEIRFKIGTSERLLIIPSDILQRFRLFRDYHRFST